MCFAITGVLLSGRSSVVYWVVAYLKDHPAFFIDQDDLLAQLRIPHLRGSSISLVERQVAVLRERNIDMRNRLTHLMDVARDNDRLFEKTRRLVMKMAKLSLRLLPTSIP